MDVAKKGSVTLRAIVDGFIAEVELNDVYCAPKLSQNLISYGRLMTKGCSLAKRNGKLALVKSDDVVFYLSVPPIYWDFAATSK
ncbi:hypothetical protein PInf_016410 [Phytophthora infestans]|nr:hypothetical protein PInf_016410 [Phytophthora infestans]